MTYDELSVFGRLRKVEKCGPYSMFGKLVQEWGSFLSPAEVSLPSGKGEGRKKWEDRADGGRLRKRLNTSSSLMLLIGIRCELPPGALQCCC